LKLLPSELDDKAQTLSYEHYYPYGGTAIIAGKDKTQVQQKCYRYTSKERDDNSCLCYYGARYQAHRSADSIALVIIDIVLSDVVFVCFSELVKRSHQANSSTWQQTIAIHPNNNRSTETQQSASDFDTNGNLLTLA
jgi:hypothetical protein